MKIGIIGAMDLEVEALRNMISNGENKILSRVKYTSGTINGFDVIVAAAGVGKVNAAVCAEAMILTYHPDIIINIGVAGGLIKDFNIGDIAIAESVVEHDMDTTAVGDELGLIPGLDVVNIECDKVIVDAMCKSSDYAENIKAVKGVIASGDQFICSNDSRQRIIDNFNAIAAEMEGASIGHVCAMNGVRFGVMRAISDGANHDSVIDYPAFCKMAAKNSVKITTELINVLNREGE